jgi:hypothetical protein
VLGDPNAVLPLRVRLVQRNGPHIDAPGSDVEPRLRLPRRLDAPRARAPLRREALQAILTLHRAKAAGGFRTTLSN